MVDYKLISDSIEHYNSEGFTRIETPWTVSAAIDNITRPEDKLPYELVHNGKRLVASGEQSFLYLMVKGYLPEGRYQTVTPCFRNEPYDTTHSKNFIKNELIITKDVDNTSVRLSVIDPALNFFNNKLQGVELVGTEQGWDIMCNGVELGSYGIRSYEGMKWIYGTGCAEPRTSKLIKQYGLPRKEDKKRTTRTFL